MKVYLPSAVTGSDCRFFTEIFPVVPFLNNPDSYKTIQDYHGYWNDGLFSKLFLTPIDITRARTINECDAIVLPFKYSPDDLRVAEFCSLGKEAGKPVISFYNDDNAQVFDLPSNLILFRTSAEKSKMSLNERIFPVLVPDHKPASFRLGDRIDNANVGFCGQIEGIRGPIVHKMIDTWKDFDFVPRSGFWAPEMSKLAARREYYRHMMNSSFTLCMRGGGNFSYRFYEALSFGRIPILIDTDMELPFEAAAQWSIKWDNHIVRLSYDRFMAMDTAELESKLLYSKFTYSPLANRELWERYFAPESYIDMFKYDL